MVIKSFAVFAMFFYAYGFSSCMYGSFFEHVQYSSSCSSQPIEKLPEIADIKAPFSAFLDRGVHMIAWDVWQGNFLVIKNCNTRSIVIVDCGSSNYPYNVFRDLHLNEMSDLFSSCSLAAVMITHPDVDHYSYLCGGLLQFFSEQQKTTSDVICFLGGASANSRCEQECHRAFKEAGIESQIYSCNISKDSFQCIKKSASTNRYYNVDIDEIEQAINLTFFHDYSDYDKFSFCRPVFGIKGNISSNDQSLVFSLHCSGSRILFTGDATEKTFKAIGYDIKKHEWRSSLQSDSYPDDLKRNATIIKSSNFVVVPHHGAHTEGSDLVLSAVVAMAETNFVGAVVLSDPQHSGPGHPTAAAMTVSFPLSAKQFEKMPLVRRHGRDASMYQTYTHRILYMPCLLPGGFLWLKLNNGLSVFMNEKYLANSALSSTSLFKCLTFKAIGDERPENSVYDYFETVIKYINIENEEGLPGALFWAYDIVVSIMQSGSGSFFWYNQFEKNFFNELHAFAKALLLFTVHLITEKELSGDERIIMQALIQHYGEMQDKSDFNTAVSFLFGLENPELVEELFDIIVKSVASKLR